MEESKPKTHVLQVPFIEFDGKLWTLIIEREASASYIPHDHLYIQDERGRRLFYLHIHDRGIDMFKCQGSTDKYYAQYHP